MLILIVRRSLGEAPEWVRDAWVGLSLPTEQRAVRNPLSFGVLSVPGNAFLELIALLQGKIGRSTGYVVNAKRAVQALETTRPDAADWWRTNTPTLLNGKRNFVFDQKACELVDDDRT